MFFCNFIRVRKAKLLDNGEILLPNGKMYLIKRSFKKNWNFAASDIEPIMQFTGKNICIIQTHFSPQGSKCSLAETTKILPCQSFRIPTKWFLLLMIFLVLNILKVLMENLVKWQQKKGTFRAKNRSNKVNSYSTLQ